MTNTEQAQRSVVFIHSCFVIDSSFVLRHLREHEHEQEQEAA
jgi:hypothetical protein